MRSVRVRDDGRVFSYGDSESDDEKISYGLAAREARDGDDCRAREGMEYFFTDDETIARWPELSRALSSAALSADTGAQPECIRTGIARVPTRSLVLSSAFFEEDRFFLQFDVSEDAKIVGVMPKAYLEAVYSLDGAGHVYFQYSQCHMEVGM